MSITSQRGTVGDVKVKLQLKCRLKRDLGIMHNNFMQIDLIAY